MCFKKSDNIWWISNKKTLDLNLSFDKNTEFILLDNRFSDSFYVNYLYEENKLEIKRTDKNEGWGYNHYFSLHSKNLVDFNNYSEIKTYPIIDSLKIYDIKQEKIRVGKNNDGGYCIILNNSYDLLLSGGISNDISFENHFLDLFPDLFCEAFDGSINNIPILNNRINFHKKYINKYNSNDNTNLHDIIEEYENIFLKLDIEGYEYPFFSTLNNGQLNKFKQIVIEFHNPDNIEKWDIIKKISTTHYPVHIHGNNFQKKKTIKDIENDNIKFKILPSDKNIKIIDLSVPLCINTKFNVINNDTDYKFKFTILNNNKLVIERIDKKEGWNKIIWVGINRYKINKTYLDIEIPNVFEITYIRKKDYDFIPNLNFNSLPCNLDMPNNPSKPEINLNYFPFVNQK